MRNISLGWTITGAIVGALGWAYNLMTLGAIINGVDVGHGWITLGIFLCPWFVPLRNIWFILILNCMLDALLLAGLRFAWMRLQRREISN
jgi:hypothetical protein